jgi:hypothetical protein
MGAAIPSVVPGSASAVANNPSRIPVIVVDYMF